MSIEAEFLDFSAGKLLELMGRIETCVSKLTPEQLWQRHSENENAVGNLLLHLNGNLRQWILHGVGGVPDLRDRNSEFAARSGASAEELVARLRSTVDEVIALIRSLPPGRLLERIQPQGYHTTVLGAIYHVVEHFAGHTFQIILLTKLFTGEDLGFYAHLSGRGRLESLP
jgi:uncharacterized damage-inducible protein DinB